MDVTAVNETALVPNAVENEQISQITLAIENAFNQLGQDNTLAMQLEVCRSRVCELGPGWEAEKQRLQLCVAQDVQLASEH